MRTFYELSPEADGSSVALGFFDGIHPGHRNVLGLAAADRERGLVPVCLTFAQSPKEVLSGLAAPCLTTRGDKLMALEAMGIEHAYLADFKKLMDMSAESFVKYILLDMLKAKHIICGFNYRFGKNGTGDAGLLDKLCQRAGVRLTVVEAVRRGKSVVSSTAIKEMISSGDVESANRLLFFPFGFKSPVEHGKRLGRELGTPTLNQPVNPGLVIPKFGVYASRVTLESGREFCGVTNVGIKPTVGGSTPLWETWMPDYKGGELYGQQADVRLLGFIRPERKFESLELLKNEIKANGKEAMKIYSKQNF